jgi:UDP-N-acetylmuramate--alanine ligase
MRDYRNIYFIGIGGIGMSALARYFIAVGKTVSGYDKTPSSLTDELIKEGIEINFEDDPKAINKAKVSKPEETLIIYTPAVPKDSKQFEFFRNEDYKIKKRSEVLGDITSNSYTLAVAGTHGKTTTSSILAHIFKHSGRNCAAFLGGITVNYNSNIILPEKNEVERADTIVEADEYDRSFLTLYPNIAIITSMDADHLDIYGEKKNLEESFNLFAAKVHSEGKLFFKKGLPLEVPSHVTAECYSVQESADHFAENISIINGCFIFDYVAEDCRINNISFKMPGRHNIENAIAAIAAALSAGIKPEDVKESLETFKGVKRRFEFIIDRQDLVFIDDYAHHPEELKACINAARELYPGKKITGVFQPHLYSRTRDFANDFAQSLDLLDECLLLEIYPARELPIEGVSSAMLLDRMKSSNKKIVTKEALITAFENDKPEVLLTLGAGDIDRLVEPLRKELQG